MASAWKTIQINSTAYIFKLRHNGAQNKTACFLSDFKTIWSEALDSSELLSRAKTENPFLDEYDAILNTTISNLPTESNATPSNIELVECNDEVKLKLKYYVEKVPFVFYWNLTQCNINVFFEEVTQTLLGHVANLQNETDTLRALLVRKDAEIAEYKNERSCPLTRRHLITEPFDQSQIQSMHLFDWSLLPLKECWNADTGEEMGNFQKTGSAAEPCGLTEAPGAMAKVKRTIRAKLTKSEKVAAPKLVYDEYDSQESCIEDIFSPTNDNKGGGSQQTQTETSKLTSSNEKKSTSGNQPASKIRKIF